MKSKLQNKPRRPGWRKGLTRTFVLSAAAISLASTLFAGYTSVVNAQTAYQPRYDSLLLTGEKYSQEEVLALVPNYGNSGSGALRATTGDISDSLCPLKSTAVDAKISGSVASVTVTQIFKNNHKEKIDAQYTFPLSHNAAVDSMEMKIGSRVIEGTVQTKAVARRIYQQAQEQGMVASLLEQERPNIFSQSIANIEPGKEIEIKVHYFELLSFHKGKFSFAFPTVVGPRFNPPGVPNPVKLAAALNNSGNLEKRLGSNISINVDLDSGVSGNGIKSMLHDVMVSEEEGKHFHINLAKKKAIPNKDFVLTWNVADDAIKSGYMTHKTGGVGYLSLMIVPPKKVTAAKAQPKEMIFVVDRSGSQSGQPLEKCKETMYYILDHMNPEDTFQIISFSNSASGLFDRPQKINTQTKAIAQTYIKNLSADGGTQMSSAIEKVINTPREKNRLRIVTMMTDGYIGNDFQVLDIVKRTRDNARWFSFGTGNSTNRFLIDNMAKEGGGEADYVLLNTPGEEAGKRFYKRIASPALTDIKVEFEGIKVEDVSVKKLSDVWEHKPLYITAKYRKPGEGRAVITGYAAGKKYRNTLDIVLPKYDRSNPALSTFWARQKIDNLMSQDWRGLQNGNFEPELEKEITRIALEHHILTQFTSFVAVDRDSITKPGPKKTVQVAPETPDGVEMESSAPNSTTPQPSTEGRIDTTISKTLKGVSSLVPRGTASGAINWLVASARDANCFDGGCTDSFTSGGQTTPHTYSSRINTSAIKKACSAPALQASSNEGIGPQSGYSTGAASTGYSPVAVRPSYSSTGSSSYNSGSAPALIGATNGTVSCAPMQGATNGTIGPQGGDATAIRGVNTAGTVRVNNLANLEAILSIIAGVLDFGIYAMVLSHIYRSIVNAGARDYVNCIRHLSWSLAWFFLGIFFLPFKVMQLTLDGLLWLIGRSPDKSAQRETTERSTVKV